MNINITAATGQLGTKITEEALKEFTPDQIVLSVRSPEKASQYAAQGVDVRKADYTDYHSMVEAFKNTDVLLYIPSISFPNTVRIEEFENAIQAAEDAKVKQFIFVGFMADQENNPFKMSPFFGYAARRLASSDLDYTLVRNAMYLDPLPPYLPELVERKRLLYPVGDGRISFISRKDIAKAVIQLAMKPDFYGGRFTLTGRKAYTMIELADILSEVSSSSIAYDPMSAEEFARTYDEPKGFGKVLASLYVAAEMNLMDEITDDVQLLTGEYPEDIKSFITDHYKKL
ncbi:SDR family oxidoreductase [Rossellomorea aquimaris]|uniref:SDR family oxidoreductase n=1 Tax=Rossellomorea aquimaris TaxID=189382 RepID=UPI001CD20AE5|nr:SDR family oxidoreductase [Rossellomorea aquimaris]MCA1057611.1 SDR family oxidoreductase [Rossellomorea aquimaris]